MGVLAIAGALIAGGLTWLNDQKSNQLLSHANELAIKSGLRADETLRNAEVIQAMGMMTNLMKRWQTDHCQVLALQAQASDTVGLLGNASKYFRIFLQSAALGVGAYLSLENLISPGMMIAGSILMGKALGPIDQLIATYKQFSSAKNSYHRLVSLLDRIPPSEQPLPLPTPKPHVLVENVSAGAPSAQAPAIVRVNLTIPAGCVVGLMGASGAGKSTLARVLAGVWTPQEGTVRIDGADLSGWDRER